MQQLFGSSFTKKPHFGNSENGKWIFGAKKMKTPLGNIVCHSNMHPCAQYEIIWTNYATNVAIRLIIWLESHWSPHVIARFSEHFFYNNCRITSLLFFLGTWPHMMTQCEGFPISGFFSIFDDRFKMRSKRWPWPFLASGWILENFWCFSD